jgi:hypothetical protein
LIEAAEIIKLTIYNRWGQLIYKNEEYQNTWPASAVDAGVYYYSVDVKDETYCKGWINVLK